MEKAPHGSPASQRRSRAVILIWIVTGPIFGFSDTWQTDQHVNHDRHLPDGLPDPEHPEPRFRGGADQA
ncbi:low affinity iron permease family protein [Geomonas silvestris]|uniref:low affinity iron permease family protein n=1 Tax=Geomonas silvestris TaxID=2740184 RepID=UPI003FCC761C